MLLLDYHNKIIEDTLLEKFNVTDDKFDSVEAIIADFDGVTFHLVTDANQKNLLNISISIKCYSTLR
jgi:actin related protein 2/3 complex subunit 2